VASGLGTWFAGSPDEAWVFGAHAVAGTVIVFVLAFKLRRVLPRLVARRDGGACSACSRSGWRPPPC
jgi:hypothetical protein